MVVGPVADDISGVSALLVRARRGDSDALRRISEVLYSELHRLAAYQMRGEKREHTLQPTALVNEVFIRFVQGSVDIESRNHFFAFAAQAMRRVLVDYARRKRSRKRGRGFERVALDDDLPVAQTAQPVDVLDLDAALTELEVARPRAASIVELKFFGGHTDKEVADVLGCSIGTIRREWDFAREFLSRRLRPLTSNA